MNDIIVRPKSKTQSEELKDVLKKMKIEFEDLQIQNYDPIFVAEIKKERADVEIGKYTVVDIDTLWK